MRSKRAASAPRRVRTASCASKARRSSTMLAGMRAKSSGVAAAVSHQSAALLRHAEGRRHLRNAACVHPALDVTNPIEGEPADQTRDDGERDRAADPQIELGREPEAAFEQPPRPGGHGCAGGLSAR